MTYSNLSWNGNIFAAFKVLSSGGGSPMVNLSPPSITGSQPAGKTFPPDYVTLSNTGNATLSISSIEKPCWGAR